MSTPEQAARQEIDRLLTAAGWPVCEPAGANITAHRGVAIPEGSKVEAGCSAQIQERDTRKKRWAQLDDDVRYDPNELDRDVVAPDQIRTIMRTLRDKLPEIFPGRTRGPKTLVFAKDDARTANIVDIVREEFGKRNDSSAGTGRFRGRAAFQVPRA